jgi:hypothetical protein
MGERKINMGKVLTTFLTSLLLTLVLYGASPALAATTVNLGTAGNFSVLAGSAITDVPTSAISGDVGLSPTTGAAITGLTTAEVTGTIYAVDSFGPALAAGNNPGLLTTAKNDLTTAYLDAEGRIPTTVYPSANKELGGLTLTPGIYKVPASSFGITGTLTLDAQGNPDAVFIFQAGSTLTAEVSSNVSLINNAKPCNVFWQVGSSATIKTNSNFSGIILALTDITLNTGANISGRALARNGAVTMDNNTITSSVCAAPTTPPQPSLGKIFNPITINETNVSTITITLTNPNTSIANLTAPLIDNLPAGVTINNPPNFSTNCSGATFSATVGGLNVTLLTGQIPAVGTCYVKVDVTVSVNGSYPNTLAADILQTDHGNNTLPAIATLVVVPSVPPNGPGGPPMLNKNFSPNTINKGDVSTLTIMLINPNISVATLTAPLIDILPIGLTIANPPHNSTTCGGTVLATPGGSNVTLLTDNQIPNGTAGGTAGFCTVTVNVTAPLGGNFLNTLENASLQTDHGNNTLPAIATLTVFPPLANISGMKFNDSNNNGINDVEQGLAGWKITLTNESGSVVTTTTDINGNYDFTGLPPGTYTVSETQQAGWMQTAPIPIPPGTYTVILNGQDVTGKDFGNFKTSSPPIPPVPELGTMVLMSAGIFGMFLIVVRNRR